MKMNHILLVIDGWSKKSPLNPIKINIFPSLGIIGQYLSISALNNSPSKFDGSTINNSIVEVHNLIDLLDLDINKIDTITKGDMIISETSHKSTRAHERTL